MKISPYTSYLELQPNALLVRQNFYYLQKVGVGILKKQLVQKFYYRTSFQDLEPFLNIFSSTIKYIALF
jgi:hypothetical protein